MLALACVTRNCNDYIMATTRRGFLSLLGAVAVGAVLDPEKLLWVPGAKTYFLPPVHPTLQFHQDAFSMVSEAVDLQRLLNHIDSQLIEVSGFYLPNEPILSGKAIMALQPSRGVYAVDRELGLSIRYLREYTIQPDPDSLWSGEFTAHCVEPAVKSLSDRIDAKLLGVVRG